MMKYQDVIAALKKKGNAQKAKHATRFFKTAKGQYGHGDLFIGVTVPEARNIAKQFADLPLTQIEKLLHSPIHEARLTALLLLVAQYKKSDTQMQKRIYALYLKNSASINNWDLVDVSAAAIVGGYLQGKKEKIPVLKKLAQSKNIWERRIAMIATFAFISNKSSFEALTIATLLLQDTHDLIHKAVGWMLREVGKRASENELRVFLNMHAPRMPRTMLRYAIERLPAKQKSAYLRVKRT